VQHRQTSILGRTSTTSIKDTMSLADELQYMRLLLTQEQFCHFVGFWRRRNAWTYIRAGDPGSTMNQRLRHRRLMSSRSRTLRSQSLFYSQYSFSSFLSFLWCKFWFLRCSYPVFNKLRGWGCWSYSRIRPVPFETAKARLGLGHDGGFNSMVIPNYDDWQLWEKHALLSHTWYA